MDRLSHISDYILTQSWQIALLTLVVAIAIFALRNKTAHVRYMLWLIVLAKCLVPPVLTVPVAVLPQENLVGPGVELSNYAPVMPATLPEPPLRRPTVDIPKVSASPLAVHTETQESLTFKHWLTLVWITGLGLYCLTALVQALRSSIWLHRHRHEVSPELNGEITETFASLAVRFPPRVWLVRGIAQPFVWGWVRGSIYLPADFAESSRDKRHRDILVHELCHVLRFDPAVNFLQVLAQALFWFHPLIWWVNHRIRTEREKCCDETTIACLGTHAKDYGKAIVNTIVTEYESTRPVPSLAIAGSTKSIEERIKSMLRPGKRFYTRPSLTAAMAVLTLALLTVPAALVLTSRAGAEAIAQQDEKNADEVKEEVQESFSPLHQAAEDGNLDRVKSLIAQGVDVMARNEEGDTPLHRAAISGHKAMVDILLENNADVNAQNNKGASPLHRAAWKGHVSVVEILLENHADINARDRNKGGATPLHIATWAGQKAVVEILLDKGADLSLLQDGWTALHNAADMANWEIGAMLIAKGLKPETGITQNGYNTTKGTTTLHFAADRGSFSFVEACLATAMDVNVRDEEGSTALYLAAHGRRLRVVESLLAAGSNINLKGTQGNTPLHAAARRGTSEIVELLLKSGADVNAKNEVGRIPLHEASSSNRDALDKVKLLIGHRSKVDVRDQEGVTPLHAAAGMGSIEMVQILIANGADVNAQTTDGKKPIDEALPVGNINSLVGIGQLEVAGLLLKSGTSLSTIHLAAYAGDLEKVREFVKQGADINGKNASELAPLHTASLGGHKQIVTFLIANGADLNAVAYKSKTPLHHAAIAGHADIAKLLISHGANVDGVAPPDRSWRIPLREAAFYARKDVVKVLLDHGAKVDAKEWTALAAAAAGGHREVAELLISRGADINAGVLGQAAEYGQNEIVKLLIKKGVNVNAQMGPNRYAPLHHAANHGHKEIAKTLLAEGAKVDVKDKDGDTPLNLAVLRGHNELVKLLIAGGADINWAGGVANIGWEGGGGMTHLHCAVYMGRKEIAKTLLTAGAKVNSKNEMGRTPLAVANQHSFTEMSEILLEYGAKE